MSIPIRGKKGHFLTPREIDTRLQCEAALRAERMCADDQADEDHGGILAAVLVYAILIGSFLTICGLSYLSKKDWL